MWEDRTIQFDGTPYFVLGQKIFDCRNGKDRKEAGRKQKVSKSSINVSMYLVFTTNWGHKNKNYLQIRKIIVIIMYIYKR